MSESTTTSGPERDGRLAFLLVLALMAGVAALPLFERYEPRLFPVLDEMRVTSVHRDRLGAVLSGELVKRRPCDFVELTFYAGDPDDPEAPRERLRATFLDRSLDVSATRELGRQPWGPWRLERPAHVSGPSVFMRATHRCHDMWRTRGMYLAVGAEGLFGEPVTAPAAAGGLP